MSRSVQYHVECDQCKSSERAINEKKIPKGWVELNHGEEWKFNTSRLIIRPQYAATFCGKECLLKYCLYGVDAIIKVKTRES